MKAVEVRQVANGFVIFTSGFGAGYADPFVSSNNTYVFKSLDEVKDFLVGHFK